MEQKGKKNHYSTSRERIARFKLNGRGKSHPSELARFKEPQPLGRKGKGLKPLVRYRPEGRKTVKVSVVGGWEEKESRRVAIVVKRRDS